MKTLYQVLGVSDKASQDRITRCYRKLAMKYHPDRNPGDARAEAKFREVQEAYEVLSDPARRARYDATGATDRTDTHLIMQVMEVLIPVAVETILDIINAGTKVERVDLVERIKNKLMRKQDELRKSQKDTKKVRDSIQATVDRFSTVDDEPSLLQDGLRGQVRNLDRMLQKIEDDLATHGRAMTHISKCRYRHDGLDPFAGMFTNYGGFPWDMKGEISR